MEWMNENAAAIQAISTVVLVVVTIFYAVSTRRLARDSELSRLAEFEPALTPVSLTYRTHVDSGAVEFKLRVANDGRGTAYDVKPFLTLGGIEREGEALGRVSLVGLRGTVQEEDKRPLSPAPNAIPSSSYQDFKFRVKCEELGQDTAELDVAAFGLNEPKITAKVCYWTTFGRNPTLLADFILAGDALALSGPPRIRGAVVR